MALSCEISKAGTAVQWKKGGDVLSNGEKYQMKQSGPVLELLIRKSQPEDSGTYSCVCDEIKTTATVIITGESHDTTWNEGNHACSNHASHAAFYVTRPQRSP